MAQYQPSGLNHVVRADEIDWTGAPLTDLPPDLFACQDPRNIGGASPAWTANSGRTIQIRAKRSGVLRDISIFVVATDTNSVEVSVYDTGETSATNYTRLYASGGQTIAGNNTWQTVGAGVCCNVVQGRDYLVMVGSNSAVLTIGKYANAVNVAVNTLPANFAPNSGGNNRKFAGLVGAGYTAPSSISEANNAANVNMIAAMGRITDN